MTASEAATTKTSRSEDEDQVVVMDKESEMMKNATMTNDHHHYAGGAVVEVLVDDVNKKKNVSSSTITTTSSTTTSNDHKNNNNTTTSSTTTTTTTSTATTTTTTMFVIRHGERWDYLNPKWKLSTKRPGDPSLSDLGLQQARETGIYLSKTLLEEEQYDSLIVLVSPFLRTIQTSNEIISQIEKKISEQTETKTTIPINLECCIWEIDGDNPYHQNHKSLPSPNGKDMNMIKNERYQYFPRVNMSYESLFIPTLPETKLESLPRLEKSIKSIEERFVVKSWKENDDSSSCDFGILLPSGNSSISSNSSTDDNNNNHCNLLQQKHNNKKQAIIVVTHAAACIGLTKAAAKCNLQEINPAGPCSIYRLDYDTNRNSWNVDHYNANNGMNGYMKHLSDWGTTTIPWNNFGPRNYSEDEDYSGSGPHNKEATVSKTMTKEESPYKTYYTGPPRNEIEHLFYKSPPAQWYIS